MSTLSKIAGLCLVIASSFLGFMYAIPLIFGFLATIIGVVLYVLVFGFGCIATVFISIWMYGKLFGKNDVETRD